MEQLRRSIFAKLRKELIEESFGKCTICGEKGLPLEIHHIIPISQGGESSKDNCVVLCPNCHRRIDSGESKEIEFINFLVNLLNEHPDYSEIETEKRLPGKPYLRADILCKQNNEGKELKSILIECTNTTFFTDHSLHNVIEQIEIYKSRLKYETAVLSFPGRISKEHSKLLTSSGIEVWDANYISENFPEQIKSSKHSFYKSFFLFFVTKLSVQLEQVLIDDLKSCPAGRNHWFEYQKIVGRILEHLFCPPLNSPIPGSADMEDINRRDWILPNYTYDNFWRFLRERYNADYIVVDAKNYKGLVGKNDILQIANYLKPHGSGSFAIIATRIGVDHGAEVTRREQWLTHKKMIVILTDSEIESMLLSSSTGGEPHLVLGEVIETFRLSF